MASAILKCYSTTKSKLSSLQVIDGQLTFTRDTKQIYLDMGGQRLGYDCIGVFASDSDRLGVLAPVEGFYYVEETGVMWRYHGSWKRITPEASEQVLISDTEEGFPKTGNPKVLYVCDTGTYRWDELTKTYIVVANKTEWSTLS